MAAKYYRTSNASRAILSNDGKAFAFRPLRLFGGAWVGVLETSDDSDIISLSTLAADPASGVKEITKEAYDAELKKKGSLKDSPIPLAPSPAPPPRPVARIAEAAGVLAAGGAKTSPILPSAPAPVAKVEDVVKIGVVKPSEPIVPVPAAKKKAAVKKPKPPPLPGNEQ